METATIKLHSGYKMPMLGLGTWQSTDDKEVYEAVVHAIDVGYRLIDTAALYQNEKTIGLALKDAMSLSNVKREDLFVVSKLWGSDHDPKHVEAACRTSMSDLGLDYLDLYLIHFPIAFKYNEDRSKMPTNFEVDNSQDLVATWKAMEHLVDLKLVRHIGISNFNSKQVELILKSCRIKPVTNQVECHPYLSQAKLKAFCEERGLFLMAYSPLGAPARPEALNPGAKAVLQDPILASIGKKYGMSVAQVALKWQLQRGCVVIPKSVKPSRLEENGKLANFELSKADMDQIDGLNCNLRYLDVNMMKASKNYPFNIEF